MASTGKGNGTLFVISLNDTAVAHSTNTTFTLSQNLRDATTKSSGGYEEVLPGLRSWEATGDFYFAEDGNLGIDDILGFITNRNPLEFTYGSGVSGDKKYSGIVYVQSVNRTDPVEDTSTYSITLKGTAGINVATTT